MHRGGGVCGSSTIKSSSPQTRWRTASPVPLVVVEEEKEENSGRGAQYSTCERQQLLRRKREAARALGGVNGQHALTPTQQIRCERASDAAAWHVERRHKWHPTGWNDGNPRRRARALSVYVFTRVLFLKKKYLFIFLVKAGKQTWCLNKQIRLFANDNNSFRRGIEHN